jgi:hypothetical protein
METYYLEKKTYAGATPAALEALQSSLTDATDLAITTATGNEFEVSATSKSSAPVTYKIHRLTTGTIERTCAPQNTGGCKAGGVW